MSDFITRIWNRLPWFSLKTKDGDTIKGKLHPGTRDLELNIETQWGGVLLLVGQKEAEGLRDWLVNAYHHPENSDGSVVPFAKPRRRT